MSDGWDEISGGREPDRDRPPRRRLLPAWSPTWSASAWTTGHRRLVGVVTVVAVTMLGTGLWAWQRAHPVLVADSVHVRVDPSEYFLPGEFDTRGQSDLLMLLRVDVAAGVAGPVRLVSLDGGGISAGDEHAVVGTSVKVTVQTRLSCDQWAGGKGVRVRFLVGPGQGQAVEVPLETGPSSALGAQVTAPCLAFDRAHPLRLTVFSVSMEPSDPVVRTTWTVVNRSGVPITLADELAVGAFGQDPPLAAQAPAQTTVLAAHGTATVFRDVAVTSCAHAQTLDPFGTLVTLTGTSDQSDAGNQIISVTLADQSVAQLYNTAKDVCLGAPDLSAARATVTLRRGPPGQGRADLAVDGRVELAGRWTVQLENPGGFDLDQPVPVPVTVQHVDGPAPFALAAGWVVRSCSAELASAAGAPRTVTVTVSGLRTYPYVLPVTYTGRTGCAPGGVPG